MVVTGSCGKVVCVDFQRRPHGVERRGVASLIPAEQSGKVESALNGDIWIFWLTHVVGQIGMIVR